MTRRPGWNPTRRNRNLGTAGQGWGQDNRFVIPGRWSDARPPLDRVGPHRVAMRAVHGRALHFVVEATTPGCVHPCTVDDVAAVLRALPAEYFGDGGLAGVVLRQPTRKARILAPVWGRLAYFAEVPPIAGPAIYLEAQPVPLVMRWGRRLRPDDREELERLRGEADGAVFDGRRHVLTFGLDALRRVQLYRTVLHEVGHLADYLTRVAWAEDDGTDRGEAYHRRPAREREDAAHGFAARWADGLTRSGAIPFPRKLDAAVLRRDGLDPDDFTPRPAGAAATESAP